MTTQNQPYPVVQALIDIFGDWLIRRRKMSELRRLGRTDLDRIAGDLRVSSNDLSKLVEFGRGAGELSALLKKLGIKKSDLVQTEPLMVRDMERVCGLCRHKSKCDHELAAGTAAEHYQDYCPNAYTIRALREPAKH